MDLNPEYPRPFTLNPLGLRAVMDLNPRRMPSFSGRPGAKLSFGGCPGAKPSFSGRPGVGLSPPFFSGSRLPPPPCLASCSHE